jgi:hypothetical protein
MRELEEIRSHERLQNCIFPQNLSGGLKYRRFRFLFSAQTPGQTHRNIFGGGGTCRKKVGHLLHGRSKKNPIRFAPPASFELCPHLMPNKLNHGSEFRAAQGFAVISPPGLSSLSKQDQMLEDAYFSLILIKQVNNYWREV